MWLGYTVDLKRSYNDLGRILTLKKNFMARDKDFKIKESKCG
jgi:hypothetical protein